MQFDARQLSALRLTVRPSCSYEMGHFPQPMAILSAFDKKHADLFSSLASASQMGDAARGLGQIRSSLVCLPLRQTGPLISGLDRAAQDHILAEGVPFGAR